MNSKDKAELNAIRQELRSIISELESISSGVRSDFVGIGNDQCAACLDRAVNQYRYVKRKLENVDTNIIKEGFEAIFHS